MHDLHTYCTLVQPENQNLRSVSIDLKCISDGKLSSFDLTMARKLVMEMPNLRHLGLGLALMPLGPEECAIDIERMMNLFRPLARLSLKTVTINYPTQEWLTNQDVWATPSPRHLKLQATFQHIEAAIKQKLLQYPALPEEAQAGMCKKHEEALEKGRLGS